MGHRLGRRHPTLHLEWVSRVSGLLAGAVVACWCHRWEIGPQLAPPVRAGCLRAPSKLSLLPCPASWTSPMPMPSLMRSSMRWVLRRWSRGACGGLTGRRGRGPQPQGAVPIVRRSEVLEVHPAERQDDRAAVLRVGPGDRISCADAGWPQRCRHQWCAVRRACPVTEPRPQPAALWSARSPPPSRPWPSIPAACN